MKNLLAILALLCICLPAFGESIAERQKKAEAGDAKAQFNLGVMYATGRGVRKDDKEAAKWYRKAAEQGDAKAQGSLGGMYYFGDGVPKDYASAYAWYKLAAYHGEKFGANMSDRVSKEMTPEQIDKAQDLYKELLKKIKANKKAKKEK